MLFRMDWGSVTFDWNRARAFLVTAEEGSLSAAARALGMTQPTVGRQVSALEEELGIALFERAGRGLVLTPTGLELVDHVRAMGDAATRVSMAAIGHAQALEGTVCITASEVTAAFLLPPIIEQLRRTEPGISLEIVSSNAPSDLLRREADIAIRSYRPTEPDLIAKKVRDDRGRLYASPDYLRRIGDPASIAALSRADFINFDTGDRLLNVLNALGLELTAANFPVISSNQLVQWACVKQGVGIGLMPEQIGDAEPAVTRVLPALAPIPIPMWLVAHRELHTNRRIRLVFDVLASELSR